MAPKKDSKKAASGRTVSPTDGEKRKREQDEEESERRVLQRTEPNNNNNDDNVAETRRSMKQIILEDLRSNEEEELISAMERLDELLAEKCNNDEDDELSRLQKELYHLGGHLAVVRAMKDKPNSYSIQLFGSGVIACATFKNKTLASAFGEVESTEAILAACKKFGPDKKNKDLHYAGLEALSNLMFTHYEEQPHEANVKTFLVDEGGLPIVLKDMKKFANDEDLVTRGCEIIDSLAWVDELRKHVFDDRVRVFATLAKASTDYKENGKVKQCVEDIMEAFVLYSRAA